MWARNCQESLFGFFCCVLAKFWKRRQFLTISSSLYINWNCQELLTFWKCSHFLVIPCLHIVSWELPGTCCIFGNSQEPLSFLTPVSGYSQPIEYTTLLRYNCEWLDLFLFGWIWIFVKRFLDSVQINCREIDRWLSALFSKWSQETFFWEQLFGCQKIVVQYLYSIVENYYWNLKSTTYI